jgi:TonB family protein
MTKCLVAFLIVWSLGCSAPHEINHDITPPELINYVPLPPFRILPDSRSLKLKFMMCVREDGTVDQVRMLQSSGDQDWDSLAERTIMQWRYAPPLRDGVPTDVWVNQRILIQFDDPIMMSFVHLSTPSKDEADSLYSLLTKGYDFETLARGIAGTTTNQRGGSVGTIDIRTCAPRIRDALKELHEGEFTHPLRSGDSYVIYKRIKKVVS